MMTIDKEQHMICDECETVAHCLKNGCVPKQPSKDEVLKLALEALGLYQATGFGNSTDFNKQHEAFYKAQTAITAIKQALAAQPAPVPLTDEQIKEIANDFEEGYVFLYRSFARAIEAAHGITEKDQP
jgi:hypothetical protein